MLGGHPRHQQLKNGPKASFRPKALICRELCLKMPLFVVFQVGIVVMPLMPGFMTVIFTVMTNINAFPPGQPPPQTSLSAW
jgi:hypothetical protein